MQSRFVLVDKKRRKTTAENALITSHCCCGDADPDVFDICRLSNVFSWASNVLLDISASTGQEKWVLVTADVQAGFLKGEFQDKDRVLYFWSPGNGPALQGVQPGSLLILKGVFGLNDAPRKRWEKFYKALVRTGFRKQRMCLGLLTPYNHPQEYWTG